MPLMLTSNQLHYPSSFHLLFLKQLFNMFNTSPSLSSKPNHVYISQKIEGIRRGIQQNHTTMSTHQAVSIFSYLLLLLVQWTMQPLLYKINPFTYVYVPNSLKLLKDLALAILSFLF